MYMSCIAHHIMHDEHYRHLAKKNDNQGSQHCTLLASSIQYTCTTARAPTCIYSLVELIRAFLFCLSVLLFASMAAAAAATLLLRSIPHISRKQSERREVRVCPLCVSIADATIGRLLHEVSVAGDGRASALGSPPFSFPNCSYYY